MLARWSCPCSKTRPEFGILESDSSAIEHIATNLVDNAVRFATRQIEIKLSRNPSHFFIRVWDDGPGIGLEVDGFPHADQMIRLTGEGPFTVPADKRLVVTGVGGRGDDVSPPPTDIEIFFDGVQVVRSSMSLGGILEIPPGPAAGPGTTVTMTCGPFSDCFGGTAPVLLGYVVDA